MKRLLVAIFIIPAISFSQVNLNKGLVAYYPFNGNANDASGNNNNPVFANTTFTEDRFGKKSSACYFNGKNNYIQIKNNALLCPEEISLVAIIKPMGFYMGDCYNNAIIDKGGMDYIEGNYGLRYTAGEYTQGDCYNPSLEHQNFVGMAFINPGITSKDLRVKLNTWYCIVFTFSKQSTRLYVNGKLMSTSIPTYPIGRNRADLFLGKKNTVQFPYWFHGVMDEIRIYNRPINAEEVLALCNKPVIKNDANYICQATNKVSAKFDFTITNCSSTGFNLTSNNTKNLKTIQWFFGDGTTSNKTAPVHFYKKYGPYKVKAIVISKTGCADTFTREIHLRELKSDFNYSEQGEPGNIQFKAKNNNASYVWDMGDGKTHQNVSVVTHTYNQSGQYKVRMLAQNNAGCVDTVEKIIEITLPVLITDVSPQDEPVSVSPKQAGIQLEKRDKEIMQVIPVENDSVSISLFDNGIVDGDSITLIYNNEVILTHQLLSSKPLKLSLYIDPQKTGNELVMYAENLGSIPPNTALMIIDDGNNRYQVNVNSSRSSNGAISFTIKR